MKKHVFILLACFFFAQMQTGVKAAPMKTKKLQFSDIAGWKKDDHRQAIVAFRKSCAPILRAARYKKRSKKSARSAKFVRACKKLKKLPDNISKKEARKYFETYFRPYEVISSGRGKKRVLTGYFEPELQGSKIQSAEYPVTVYRKPDDLVMIRGAAMKRMARRSGLNRKLTWAKKGKGKLYPYPTRETIEKGYLNNKGLELLYLSDPVDAFYMHIQGSARVNLDTGEKVRIGFAAKNGYPFGSVERKVINKGLVPRNRASQQHIKAWLRANPGKARELFWVNRSYIFFREIKRISEDEGPIGAQGISLTAGRSLAVDNRFHKLGTPIWIVGKNRMSRYGRVLRRLMIAQDVGTAIKGRERGDIFVGSGDRAGTAASNTYLQSNFIVLLPV